MGLCTSLVRRPPDTVRRCGDRRRPCVRAVLGLSSLATADQEGHVAGEGGNANREMTGREGGGRGRSASRQKGAGRSDEWDGRRSLATTQLLRETMGMETTKVRIACASFFPRDLEVGSRESEHI
ncbi:hypothetical protein CEXT_613881 [Caerostris extrusa]|uniref:Uncharacterized protein n=1 Tax=Caerostris extrusa TaxID=172846 RepID=A0AAV4NDH2_CAEEX|nr:hypothetical protein CEXT_613881 [Caerostris extrusa]